MPAPVFFFLWYACELCMHIDVISPGQLSMGRAGQGYRWVVLRAAHKPPVVQLHDGCGGV